MTKSEQLRQHPEYIRSIQKIKSYRKGFKFTMNYNELPRRLVKGMKFILHDSVIHGYLETVSFEFDINGNLTSETFVRL